MTTTLKEVEKKICFCMSRQCEGESVDVPFTGVGDAGDGRLLVLVAEGFKETAQRWLEADDMAHLIEQIEIEEATFGLIPGLPREGEEGDASKVAASAAIRRRGGHVKGGSIGCFLSGADPNGYLLTSGHTIMNTGQQLDIGEVLELVDDRSSLPKGEPFVVDAALVGLAEGVQGGPGSRCDPMAMPLSGMLATTKKGRTLSKCGNATLFKKGKVEATGACILCDVGGGKTVVFEKQIVIKKSGFADKGDSGSLVIDSNRNSVGILMAQDFGTPPKLFAVNPIAEVLAMLDQGRKLEIRQL